MKESRYIDANKFSWALAEITKSPTLSSGCLKDAADLIAKEGCHALNTHRVGIWKTANRALADSRPVLSKCLANAPLGTDTVEALENVTFYDRETRGHFVAGDFDLSKWPQYVSLLNKERLIVINDVKEANSLQGVAEAIGPDLCSLMDAPIRVDGKVVGVVCIEQFRCEEFPEKRRWTAEEQNFASSLADFVAIAMESAERHAIMRHTESMMNNLPGMAFQFLNDPPRYSFAFVSEGCLPLTGYSQNELTGIGINFFDLAHPDDAEQLEWEATETIAKGLPLEATFRIVTKEEATKWVWKRSRVAEFNSDGTPYLYEGFLTDVTEQRKSLHEIELLAVQNRQAEENYEQIKTHLKEVSGLKHDIRNHVTAMLLLMRDGQYKEAEAYLEKYAGDNLPVAETAYHDNFMINIVADGLFQRAKEHGIEVDLNLNAAPTSVANHDLYGLLTNLTNNAIEACAAMPEGKERFIRLSITRREPYLNIRCQNSKSGKTASVEGRLQTTKAGSGHGYGLWTVERIVDAYDGMMNIEYDEDTFTIAAALKDR
jgi:PAS domain S-box-containing protein